MSETDDIVERLNAQVPLGVPIPICHLLDEAADHITRLEERCAALEGQVEAGAAEIERLTRERNEALKELHLKWCISCGTLTSDDKCDCTMDDDTAPLQDLKLFSDEYRRQTEDHIANTEREVADLKEEVGRLRETLEKADTPNQFWSWEDPESGGPDLDYVMDDCPHDGIEHLLCGRSLPDRWGAFRCLTVDEDGDPEETVIETFATKEQAERCWPESLAAARAALQPQEPKP